MPDTALGQCDMVLAVSQDTINYQFQQLWKRGLIRQTWKVLVRAATKTQPAAVKTQEDADFDTALSTWQSVQANIAQLFADQQYEAFGKALAAAQAAGQLWDYGWSGQVASPIITVLAGDTQNLLFGISFSSGTLLYCPNTTQNIQTWDLKGTVYSFRVPIGRLVINSTQEILTPEGQNQANVVIRDSGLTDSDFSIEALFLDFENANVANFDSPSSHFPQGATTAIQNTVVDYFKLVVAGQKNPFVLGYALNVKQITSRAALFQPTSARFSTSYSTQRGCSAVNFLMMGGNRDFPSGQNVGVLSQSLLEGAGLDSTDDGVFGIDWPLFRSLLIDPFVSSIADAVAKGFPQASYSRTAQQWSLTSNTTTQRNVSSPPSDLLHDTHLKSDRTVTSKLSLTNSSTGLQLGCTVEYLVKLSVEVWEVLHWGYHTEYSARLSTSGTYKPGPKGTAQIGSATLAIQPGTQGAVNFNVTGSQGPVLGYDRAPDTGSKITGGPWGIVQALWNDAASQDLGQAALDASSDLGGTINNVTSAIQSTINSLALGKVILPLGQLYTFKQIRLRNTAQTDDNAVVMSVAYAPVTQ